MLFTRGYYQNTTKYQFLRPYTSGCAQRDPALLLVQLEEESQAKVDDIWGHIAEIDTIGRSVISEECGGNGLDALLSSARNIAKLLTKERRALNSLSESLKCERINPLYTDNIHGSICTDFAEASAWGMITFSVLAISMMTLLTLRASWLVHVDEGKIYHDESEVAENMIVDEHEEYLRYISRYKHEWQEYDGFVASTRKSASFSEADADEGTEEDEQNDIEFDSASDRSGYSTNQDKGRFETNDVTSLNSGDISFPSLNMPPTPPGSTSTRRMVSPVLPSILTDLSKSRKPHQSTENQEVMLAEESLPVAPGEAPGGTSTLVRQLKQGKEEEKTEMEQSTPPSNIRNREPASAESDFSSIGKNASGSPLLYWRSHLGLGIEVALSSATDSLVVSPNSESELSSFDLTKTPSPTKKSRAGLGADKVCPSFPHSLYLKNSSDENDEQGDDKTKEAAEHLPLRKTSSQRSAVSGAPASCTQPVTGILPASDSLTQQPKLSTIDVHIKEMVKTARLSPGSSCVKTKDQASSPPPRQNSVTREHVNHLSGARPKTPKRTTKRLFDYVHRLDPKSTPKDFQTI